MQIEKARIKNRLRILASRKFYMPTIYNLTVTYP